MGFINKIVNYDSSTNLYKIGIGDWVTNSIVNGYLITKTPNNIKIESNFNLVSILYSGVDYNIIDNIINIPINDITITSFIFELVYTSFTSTCKNVDNEIVDSFTFNSDGIVYGYSNLSTPKSINIECCSSLGYNFDVNVGKCFWKTICNVNNPVKVIINSDTNDGFLFDNEPLSTLSLSFKYLLNFDDKKLLLKTIDKNISDLLSNIKINFSLNRVLSNNTLETIKTAKLFDGSLLSTYFNNINSGVHIDGFDDNIQLKEKLSLEYGSNYKAVNFKSKWLEFNMAIDAESEMLLIRNKKLKIGIDLNNYDLAFLIDDVKINKVTKINTISENIVKVSPKFDLNRVVDNKKSWVTTESPINRSFDYKNRFTKYDVKDSRLVLNSKEIDLSLNQSNFIDNSFFKYLLSKGEISFNDFYEFKNTLLSTYVDVKSRKVLTAYPKLRVLYDKYLDYFSYNYSLVNKIDSNWVNLVEHVIPSTTIWGATISIKNNFFDNSKFTYKRYNILYGNLVNESIYNDINLSVTLDNKTDYYDKIYIKEVNDSSEFVGSINIIGDSNQRNNNIIINETF